MSRPLFSWLAAVLLTAAATLPAQAGAKPAVRRMRKAVQAIEVAPASGRQAVAAIQAMAEFDGRAGARALLDAVSELQKKAAPIVEKRRKALASEGGSGRLKRSRYELQNLDDAVVAIAATLAKMRSEEALRVMLARLTDRGSQLPLWLRLALASRVAELPEPKLDWRRTKAGKSSPETLLALLRTAEGLGARAGEACGEWLVRQLRHDNRDVRVAAAQALSRLAWPGGIRPLIDRLEHEQGDVREALLDALVVLTGQDPGDGPGPWRAWLADQGAPFLAGDRKLSRGDASTRRRASSGNTVSGSYFGIEQTGAGILYVFDNSLSMKAKLKKAKAANGPTTGVEAETRWQLCKLELRRALRGLTPDKTFNLVSFANKARCFEQAVVPASEANVRRAIEWIDGLELEFQTNVFDALELAFLIAGRGVGDRYYQPQVDTMFFLSDGAPTIPNLDKAGIRQDDSDRILQAVARWNALGRVRIHAVGLGLQRRNKPRNPKGRLWPSVFLQRLAEQNGGRYVLKR